MNTDRYFPHSYVIYIKDKKKNVYIISSTKIHGWFLSVYSNVTDTYASYFFPHFTPTVSVSSHNANRPEVTALRAWGIRPLLRLLCSGGCLLHLSCSPALPHLTEAILKWKMCVYTVEDGRKPSSLGDYGISSSTPSKDSQVLDPGI